MTTQFARASYQEIIDLHTESDKVSVIGIHTPTSDTPRKMFGGFFDQFKKFKYLGCSISLVPAARLPADPLQVSYEAGEPTIDPRDMLNPIMFHGCHGNDMGVILNRLYALNTLAGYDDAKLSDSIFQVEASTDGISDMEHFAFGEQLENLYYKALTDNTWKKAHPQRGFKKSGLIPMVYSMATNMQFNGSSIEMEGFGVPSPIADIESFTQNTLNDMKRVTVPVTQDGRRFFTPRLVGLGWLDTRNVLTVEKYTEAPANTSVTAMLDGISELQTQEMEASLPLVYMGMILMPPAYKTEQYFRMIVNHHFAFKDFRGISFMPGVGIMNDDGDSISPAYANFNDSDYEYDGPTGGEVDPPNPDEPENPGEGGGDDPEDPPAPTYTRYEVESTQGYTLNNETITTASAIYVDSGDNERHIVLQSKSSTSSNYYMLGVTPASVTAGETVKPQLVVYDFRSNSLFAVAYWNGTAFVTSDNTTITPSGIASCVTLPTDDKLAVITWLKANFDGQHNYTGSVANV